MTEISCAALLFDLDGVLIDSTPAVERVWRGWAQKHGLDVDDVVMRAHGRPTTESVLEMLPGCDLKAETDELERLEIADVADIIPLPGVLELLRSLPPERWTIATSGTRALAETRIRAAGLPAPARFITATDITHGKPHPEPYLKAAALLGYAPEECIVVEDAAAGVRSGKTAGARVIALRTTMPKAQLREAGANWVVDDCAAMHLLGANSALRLLLNEGR